ncbi:MAG: PIN domain-containing protein [Marinilabiliaceae bacterium]|nr:PIN domain-containing protein [Marinilabiliaceae bacterium]
MVYVVVDTNVLMSALWTRNPFVATRRVLDLIMVGEIVPRYNEEMIEEYRSVRRFALPLVSNRGSI